MAFHLRLHFLLRHVCPNTFNKYSISPQKHLLCILLKSAHIFMEKSEKYHTFLLRLDKYPWATDAPTWCTLYHTMLQRVVVRRDNENNMIKDLPRKTNLSEKFHDPIPKRLIQKPKLPELCSIFPRHIVLI